MAKNEVKLGCLNQLLTDLQYHFHSWSNSEVVPFKCKTTKETHVRKKLSFHRNHTEKQLTEIQQAKHGPEN